MTLQKSAAGLDIHRPALLLGSDDHPSDLEIGFARVSTFERRAAGVDGRHPTGARELSAVRGLRSFLTHQFTPSVSSSETAKCSVTVGAPLSCCTARSIASRPRRTVVPHATRTVPKTPCCIRTRPFATRHRPCMTNRSIGRNNWDAFFLTYTREPWDTVGFGNSTAKDR